MRATRTHASSARRHRNRRRLRQCKAAIASRAPPRAATAHADIAAGERDRPAAQSLHRECEIGQAVVIRERSRATHSARVERGQRAAMRPARKSTTRRTSPCTSRRHAVSTSASASAPHSAGNAAHHAKVPRQVAVHRRRTARAGDRGSSHRPSCLRLRHLAANANARWKSCVCMHSACACASASIAASRSIAHSDTGGAW